MKEKRSYGLYIFSLLVIVTIIIGLLVWGNLPFLDSIRSDLGLLRTTVTSGDVVNKLTAASYLTTTRMTIKVIAKDDTDGFLSSHKMLLFAKGTVEAGIDLSRITPANVVVSADGKNITVTLPPVSIHRREYSLSTNVDDTYVVDYGKDWFADTKNVQAQLRSEANDGIVKSACKADIMRRATLNARITIEVLLKNLLPNVNVTVLSGPIPSLQECETAQ